MLGCWSSCSAAISSIALMLTPSSTLPIRIFLKAKISSVSLRRRRQQQPVSRRAGVEFLDDDYPSPRATAQTRLAMFRGAVWACSSPLEIKSEGFASPRQEGRGASPPHTHRGEACVCKENWLKKYLCRTR
jgi:hypothetical protein